MRSLTLQFIPYDELTSLTSIRKIKRLVEVVKENKIVLLEGRLSTQEEANLIEHTMEHIDKTFKGIEICTVYPTQKTRNTFEKIRKGFYNVLLGNRKGMTVIGPASIVKEIKRDPNRIQLIMNSKFK